MYIEPVNLGWHFNHLDAIISSGFFAPSGPYNSGQLFNIGFGHWTGMFGLGGVFYPDAERTWSASVYAHYLLYGSQMGRNYTLGDDVPLEWGIAKTFNLPSAIFEHLTVGPSDTPSGRSPITGSTLPQPRRSKPLRSTDSRTPGRRYMQPGPPSSS
jgi:hypothetical protein